MGKFRSKTPSTQTRRTRLKSDLSGKTNSSNGDRKLSDFEPPRFGTVSAAQQKSMRQLSEEQEMTMDMCSEISDSPFDSNSSGYGSGINGHSNGSDLTHSTFLSDTSNGINGHMPLGNNNNSNSSGWRKRSSGSKYEVKKQPLTKVLSSTSC